MVASEREGLQHGSETFCDMWFGDGGTKKTTGNQRTGGRAKDFLESDQIETEYIRGTTRVEQFGDEDKWARLR